MTPLEGCDDGNAANGDGCSATCTIEAEYSCTRGVSFANLSVQDFAGSTAQWTVAPDNSSGLQTQNTARPTVALFGEDAMNGTFNVRMAVETVADDDFIGLALGFKPGDQNNVNANYLVVDWKQLLQDGVGPGLKLAHVRGIPTAADHIAHGIPLRACPNATTSCVTQLANARTLGTTGWADNTPYTMRVTYTANRFELVVNGSVEFAVTPADFPAGQFPGNVFPSGQIGFYLLSQENVRYTNLSGNGASVCNVTSLADANRDVATGTASVTFDVAALLTDMGDLLAPLSVAITSITGGTGTVSVAANGNVTFTPANPSLVATYVLRLFACDNDEVIPDCDTSTITIRYRGDTDGDGINDLIDLDDDNDGIPDSIEYGKDTDGDGIFDDVDLDSDNDGLPDVAEAGHGGADANGDGLIDCPGGFGANGFCDAVETTPDSGTGRTPPIDTDMDGIPDFRDIDSDDDGIPDRLENGTICTDNPSNGVCDGTDPDRDGVPGNADGKPGFGTNPYPTPPDTDGDGTPDYRDLDADGDGIPDIVESGGGATDTNNDGRVDGPDVDGDGLRDPRDDSDGDGIADINDMDPPIFGGAFPQVDTDMDGIPDVRDPDSDNDGIPDAEEGGDDPTHPVDGDEDGIPDFQDPDSDNDMIGDNVDNCRLTPNDGQANQDGDELGDECDPDDNNDGFADGIGVSGGGCSTTNGGGAGGLGILLGLAGMVMVRRRKARAAAAASVAAKAAVGLVVGGGAVAAVSAVTATEAHAQVSSKYSAERFALTGHRDGILGVEWADVKGHLVVDVGLWMGYANDPVNVYQMSDGERIGSLVANRIGGDLVGAIRLKNRFELGIAAPVIVAQSEDLGSMNVPGTDIGGFGLGDLRLTPKVTLFRKNHFALAAMVGVSLPTSTADDYGGDDGLTVSPALAISNGGAVGLRFAVAAGYRARPKATAINLVVDDEVYGQLGLAYRFPSSLEIDGTFDVATGADDVFGAFNRNHAEARAGLAYDVTSRVRMFGAGGAGLAEGFGTPDWRALLGLRLLAAEDKPQIEKPLPPRVIDSDGDGIMDPDDRCVAEPETKNDFEDSDGCPDNPDPDGDKIIGSADSCPTEAEDFDSFSDTDGCPDPDNDGDTVLDVVDECPMIPGKVELKGCPEPDRDGDTVIDRLDNCPDEPGTVENHGCKAKQIVKLTDSKIEILDIVYFSLNRAVIEKRSFPLLDEVARVVGGHPEITKVRIEGHTDNKGNDAYNKKLSQRRADAVKAYLVKKGMSADRLDAVGFGEEQPKDSNDTNEGRAANRRVEFVIVGATGVEVKSTGPAEDTMEKK